MKQNLLIWILAMTASMAIATETFVELGKLAVNAPVRHTVIYKNANWLKPVQIEKVETSCKCLRILSYPSEVSIKSSVEIAFELTPDTIGQFGYELTITPSSGEPQMFVLGVDVQEISFVETAAPAVLPARVITPRDQSFYLTPAEIASLSVVPSFVDVRSASAFRECRIPGSMNVSRSFVRSKGWLKNKPVVLVDSGWGDAALEETVRSLEKAGFSSVHILHGGLTAWRAAGQRTEGALPGLPSLSALTVSDYLRTRNFDDWLVLDVRSEPAGLSLPESIAFSVPQSMEQFRAELSALTAGGQKRVLIMDADGGSGSELRRALATWDTAPVFYLSNGVKGLAEYQRMVLASAGRRTETVSSHSRVARAGSGATPGYRPKKKGGCGTCPN